MNPDRLRTDALAIRYMIALEQLVALELRRWVFLDFAVDAISYWRGQLVDVLAELWWEGRWA